MKGGCMLKNLRSLRAALTEGSWWLCYHHAFNLYFEYLVVGTGLNQVTFKRGCGGTYTMDLPRSIDIVWHPEKDSLTIFNGGVAHKTLTLL